MSDLTYCLDCGMPVAANEYHPFAACLMFKACGNTMVVRMNLDAIINRATAAPVVVGEVVAWWNGDIDSYPVTNRDLAERLGYRRPLYERQATADADEAMALHWIDRYAVGIDDEPQMDRIREALGCKEAGNAD